MPRDTVETPIKRITSEKKAIMKILILVMAMGGLSACASSVDIPAKIKKSLQALDSGVTYRAEGRFDVENKARGEGRVYYFHMNKAAFVRWIRIDTLDPIKSIKVYVRGNAGWDLVNAIQSGISAGERIHVSRRTDAVMIVQPSSRHDEMDYIRDIYVFAQDKSKTNALVE